ncbi:saccharopine dehydrogenase C-terminal domain-containing protein [soil metagenome]
MKLTVLGAGAIGSAVAYDLCSREEVTRVQICDTRPNVVRLIRGWLDSPKVRCYQVNARDQNTLESVIRGSDCVVACTPAELYPGLSELALNLGAHYCDLGGDHRNIQRQLAMNDLAEQRSRWIVPNCGFAPGLANLLCMRGLERFESVETAYLRVGDVPTESEPPFNYRLAHAASKLIDSYTSPATILRHGEVAQVPPLSDVEPIDFGDLAPELGPLEAFHASGLVSTLPEDLEGRVQTLDAKTVRYRGHAAQFGFLTALGLAERKSIDVRTHLTYRDVLARRLQSRLGGEYADTVLLRVQLEGIKDGREQTLTYEMVERYDENTRLSAMRRCTAFPTAAIAVMLASRQIPGGGAAPPERVIPSDPLLEDLRSRGMRIQSEWHEGWLSTRAEAVAA